MIRNFETVGEHYIKRDQVDSEPPAYFFNSKKEKRKKEKEKEMKKEKTRLKKKERKEQENK